MWIAAAVGSALFAGITAVLSKCGVRGVRSDIATAVRTAVVLAFSWLIVWMTGAWRTLGSIDGRSWLFLVLSGLATGASWICYFKALSLGEVTRVAAVDKSSVVLSVLFAMMFFSDERTLWWLKLIFLVAIACGTALMTDIHPGGNRGGKSEPDEPGDTGENSSKDELGASGANDANRATDEAGASGASRRSAWLLFAVLSAVFAAATSLLAKVGIENTDSNAATAIRTGVVLILAWLIVFCRGESKYIRDIGRRDLLFLVLSGVATGVSWLCYYYAVQQGRISIVVPIDKLSVLVTVLFSLLVFREKLSARGWIGLSLLTGATVCMAVFT